jgi:chitinase
MAQNDCRPDGLAPTPGVTVNYGHVYDKDGREKLANGQARRTIGYFNGGRTGKDLTGKPDGTPAYLVNNIPWDKITHINYAFAHIDTDNKVSVGPDGPGNAATGMEWPGVSGAEMDPSLKYKGHFNLLTKYKKQHSDVRTLISVGGWAETGGILTPNDPRNPRQATGGFYKLTTKDNTTDPQVKIDTFADSVVDFLRTYGFDGVDIDYEYATSMNYAGNPDDYWISNPNRATLVQGYVALMKTLRTKLDTAAVKDDKYYLLTAAVSGSPWVLRGAETYQVVQYLDYANIMSYDLHGSWNLFVGPNAALFDDGKDAELTYWKIYTTKEYDGFGDLNTDWAYHYFRGAMQAGRINVGVPFYTRGWQKVKDGTNGLWGTAELPNQKDCPPGTNDNIHSPVKCGNGAIGIDNIWYDVTNGLKVPAGVNPMWHAKNLEAQIQVDEYLEAYKLDPKHKAEDRLTGTYTRYYDSTLVAPWLWNTTKEPDKTTVFLSTEDEESIKAKAQYVVKNGIGGLMIWELAGDYAYDEKKKYYHFGTTLVDAIHSIFVGATLYGATKSRTPMHTDVLDVSVDLVNFPLGDKNYPITPTMRLTNNSTTLIPEGATVEFDYGTSAPGNMTAPREWKLTVTPGHKGPNVGGLKADFQHVTFTVPTNIPDHGGKLEGMITYYLPIATPSNFKITINGKSYGITHDYPRGSSSVNLTATSTQSG